MGSFSYDLTTTATAEQTLAYLADLRNLEAWVGEVEGVEASGDGYKVRLDRGFLMPDMVIDYVVATETSAVVATGTNASMDVVDRWEVAPAGTGAEVRYLGTYELKGMTKLVAPAAQFFGGLRADGLAVALGQELDQLYEAVEGRTAAQRRSRP